MGTRSHIFTSIHQLSHRNKFIRTTWTQNWKMVGGNVGLDYHWHLSALCNELPFLNFVTFCFNEMNLSDSYGNINEPLNPPERRSGIRHWYGGLLHDARIRIFSRYQAFSGIRKCVCIRRCSVLSRLCNWTSVKVKLTQIEEILLKHYAFFHVVALWLTASDLNGCWLEYPSYVSAMRHF